MTVDYVAHKGSKQREEKGKPLKVAFRSNLRYDIENDPFCHFADVQFEMAAFGDDSVEKFH